MVCESCGDKPKNESRDFPKAVVEINNPESLVLLRKVVIPASMGDDTNIPASIGKYRNVLLHYDANGRNYIYSSDGIPTVLDAQIPPEIYERIEDLEEGLVALDNSLATVAKTGSYTDLTNTPSIPTRTSDLVNDGADGTSTYVEADEMPVVDSSLSKSSTNAIQNKAVSTALDNSVMTGLSVNANTSTTTVQLDGAKKNLYSGTTATDNIPLPVASTTQAGVMNSSTYDAITNNTSNINALMNGAVAITGLSASPSQSDLTTAWETETGLTTLMNRAGIYDVSNDKVWTYYSNTSTWYAASNTSQVTINTFTNSSEGTIKGSTNVGQIFAENDGTGSVNGWDSLSGTVATHTSDIAALQAAIPTVNDATLTIQNNGTNVATFTANSATNTTANIISPVDIGSVLSTPTDVAYINTNNIIDGAVTSAKLDYTTMYGGNMPVAKAASVKIPWSDQYYQLYRIGNIVYASGDVVIQSMSEHDSEAVAERVPDGFKPVDNSQGIVFFHSVAGTNSADTNIGIKVFPDGSCSFSNKIPISGSTRLYGHGVWFTKDNWPNS